MTFKTNFIALVGAFAILAAPVMTTSIDAAGAKTMMKMKKPPRAHDNKQTKSGGQPGGSAARN